MPDILIFKNPNQVSLQVPKFTLGINCWSLLTKPMPVIANSCL